MSPVKCDRCGKVIEKDYDALYTIYMYIDPPKVGLWADKSERYYGGEIKLCTACMDKVIDCIDELGRDSYFNEMKGADDDQ